jgi:hypothetical protein
VRLVRCRDLFDATAVQGTLVQQHRCQPDYHLLHYATLHDAVHHQQPDHVSVRLVTCDVRVPPCRDLVKLYANNQQQWFTDFSSAYNKLIETGYRRKTRNANGPSDDLLAVLDDQGVERIVEAVGS